jgi:DNA helicase-2/ATP-dependent DNA helicase PcrA
MDILAELNPAQRQAVEAINGPVLILAGPGSGKTRVITHRIAYLIRVCRINPRRILAVTFTNKAAREMESRLKTLVSTSVEQLTIGTFHAICAKILRIDGKAIGIDPKFVIYDDDDQVAVIKRCFEELRLDPKQYNPSAVATAVSHAKSRMISPSDYQKHNRSYFEEIVGRVYERYEQMLRASQALDFDDLLLKVVELFQKNPEILKRYQERYVHVMVDEFQDTNLVQYELVKLISGKYRNICVVGDPDQSIYSWRSADLRNILSFEKDFPDASIIFLEQNYRSTKTILETASHVISANKQRKPVKLWTENVKGEKINLVEAFTEQEEALFVVREVERLVSRGEFKPGDIAVMYRTNAQSRVLEEAFIRYGMPYRLVAGTRFYERREVKDVIAYFRLIQNPQDSVSLLRIINVPGRGIGQQTLGKLTIWAGSLGISTFDALNRIMESRKMESSIQQPFDTRAADVLGRFVKILNDCIAKSREKDLVELFDFLMDCSGYRQYTLNDPDGQDRWENVMELRTVAEQYRDLSPTEGLMAFLEKVALVTDVDEMEEGVDRVTLITLHQAKGLEFPVVFIIGMEEKLLPHIRSMDDPAQMEEERRLAYVGITRAKKKVYLVHAFRRSFMGTSTINAPSRFLEDIPKELTVSPDWSEDSSRSVDSIYSWNRVQAREPLHTTAEPALELKDGDRVRHAQFGEGLVVATKKVKNDFEVTVAFDKVGLKRLMLSFARLEKIS